MNNYKHSVHSHALHANTSIDFSSFLTNKNTSIPDFFLLFRDASTVLYLPENDERQLARVKSDFCPITLACRPAFFSPVGVPGCRPGRRSINSLKLGSSNERKSSSIWGWWLAGLEIGRKMKRERGGLELGGCPSRGWSITEQNGRGIEAQKERWLKARLEFPSILSGGKFSCSLVHDFRANEYRGQGIGCKGIRPLHGQRMLVGLSRRGCASVILPRIYASACNAAWFKRVGGGKKNCVAIDQIQNCW